MICVNNVNQAVPTIGALAPAAASVFITTLLAVGALLMGDDDTPPDLVSETASVQETCYELPCP